MRKVGLCGRCVVGFWWGQMVSFPCKIQWWIWGVASIFAHPQAFKRYCKIIAPVACTPTGCLGPFFPHGVEVSTQEPCWGLEVGTLATHPYWAHRPSWLWKAAFSFSAPLHGAGANLILNPLRCSVSNVAPWTAAGAAEAAFLAIFPQKTQAHRAQAHLTSSDQC